MIFEESLAAEIAKSVMSEWPLQRKEESVKTYKFSKTKLYVGWHCDFAYWDANLDCDIFYLLDIELAREHRGQGHGRALYLSVEEIARRMGAYQIRQTPSGKTGTGETRHDYLLRHGWKLLRHGWRPCLRGKEVYKVLDQKP